jgi:dihydropyrimidinase
MEQIEWARGRGMKIYAETCPQYLVLTADDLKGLNMDMSGAKYVCSPPPRDRASQDAIWRGLEGGVFQTFSSDHCPFRFDDEAGKKHPKARTSFRWVPNGIPGVAARLPILFSEGVAKGRISLTDFVALTSTNHAKMYGLYPRKGSIMVGADADIVLWDADKRVTLTHDLMLHGSDYTPYECMEVTGWPIKTLLRGEVIADEGKIVGAPGFGQFLPRETTERPHPTAGP